MSPEITVHRPRGVLPKVVVQKRTVVDYQPSWLLIAIPALVVLRARRRKSQAQHDVPQHATGGEPELASAPTGRSWRRGQVVVGGVPRPRFRRRERTASSEGVAAGVEAPPDAEVEQA